jgi:P27 family predicted phage terminase small subunit
MSRRGGPAPAPTKLKVIKGEKPSRINQREPKPEAPPSAPSALEWLSPAAKAVWDSLVPQLHAKGLFTDWDQETFAVFCEAVVHHRLACEATDGSAILVRGAHGNFVKNPALQIVRDCAQTIRAFAQEFGLTPSARSGIELPEGADYDEARRLLS